MSQYIHTIGRALVTGTDVTEIAKRYVGAVPNVIKAGVAAGASGTWGSSLSDWSAIVADWVRLTSSRTVLGRLNARRVPFRTRAIVDPGVTAAYAEALPVTASSLTATTNLAQLRIGCVAVFTRELFETTWAPAVEESIIGMLELAVRRGLDLALVDPDSSASANVRPASLLNGVSPLGDLTNTTAGALADVQTMINALTDAGSDLERALFVLHPRTATALSVLNTSGVYTFPELTPVGGRIAGIPAVTTIAAARSGSPSERVFALIDGGRVVLADDERLDVNISMTTDLEMDSAPAQSAITGSGQNMVGMWQTNSIAVKAVRVVNFEKAHSSAVAWMTAGF